MGLRLEPGIGNDWCIYNATSRPPETRGADPAVITRTRNTTDERISLIFWEANGGRVGPISLSSDQASMAFSELDVAGTWEAHVGGTEADAPPYVTIEIFFEFG